MLQYQHLIIKGIQGLPPDILSEINDCVYFLRKRRNNRIFFNKS